MNVTKRLLGVAGASAMLLGAGIATPVFAVPPPFSAIIDMQCANPGDTQTISVLSAAGALIHIEVSIGGNTLNGGTQNGTGLTSSNGTFTDQWVIPPASPTGTATVKIWAFTNGGVASGSRTFTIQPATQPCASPNTVSFNGSYPDLTQVGGTVAKKCDAGVTGNAVFSATIHLNASSGVSTTTVALPAALSLTLACNGASQALPTLPPTSTITLHESTLPAGAVAAADTTITVGTAATLTTIHNTKAAVATASPTPTATPRPTPTPPTAVLAQTGSSSGTPMLALVATGMLGLLALGAGTMLALRRKS